MSNNCDQPASAKKKQKLDREEGKSSMEVDDEQKEDFSVDPKYSDFVTPEEVEKLKEFTVLDEVTGDNSGDEGSVSSDGSVEVPNDEIERMLDEDLPENFKGAPEPKEKPYVTSQKIVLEEKGINHFEVLPQDWLMVRHYSGMPVYLHRSSRVCTLAKPYFIGTGNAKRHDIPISAIPCLNYRRALEEEEKQEEMDKMRAEHIKNGTWDHLIAQAQNCPTKNKQGIAKNNISNIMASETMKSYDLKAPKTEEQNVEINASNESKCNDEDSKKLNINKDSNKNNEDNSTNNESAIVDNLQNTDNSTTIPSITDNSQNTDSTNINSEPNSSKTGDSTKDPATENDIPLAAQPVILPGGLVMSPPRVENVNSSWKTQHLSHEQVNEYCKKLFKFKTVNMMHFNRWADKRKYAKARRTLQHLALPQGTKLITIPAANQSRGDGRLNGGGLGNSSKREFVMKMSGRSSLSALHEYVRRVFQKQPDYELQQLENASSPYQATVYIGGMQYGCGRGTSKRAAKTNAARASLHILIPEMRLENDAHEDQTKDDHFSFFDSVTIEDPRVAELCSSTSESSPHDVLRTALMRNFGVGTHLHTEMKKLESQNIELTMKVGKHSATVVCKNKKTAKQRASQAILQALHPHVRSWGSLLRLYGSQSVKSYKEKKQEEQEITLLQNKAQHNAPNYAVLEKLKEEMQKVKERHAAVVPIGTLLFDDLPKGSSSSLNNVDL